MKKADLTTPATGGFLASKLATWNQFWFAPGDPTVLGLIRILSGLILLYVLGVTSMWLSDIYGRNGWVDLETANILRKETPWFAPQNSYEENMPAAREPERGRPNMPDRADLVQYRKRWGMDPSMAYTEGTTQFSLWYHVSDPTGMAICHGLILLVALAFTLGLWTRVTSVLAWLGFLCYIHRTPASGFGMDTMVAILLLYLAIGPSGSALSLDRLWARYRAKKLGILLPEQPEPSSSATFALRLLQVHFCMIYLASGLAKLQGSAWWSGTALWQTLANYEFAGPRGAWGHAGLVFLAQQRWLWELTLAGGALFTLFLEISLPYLIWIRAWRGAMLIGAVLLHTGIAMSMGGLGAFSLAMLAIVVSFVPAESVHAVFGWVQRKFGRLRAAEASAPALAGATRVPAKAAATPAEGRLRYSRS